MTALLRPLYITSIALMSLGCGNASGDEASLGVARQAVNACAEAVPATRAVDGFPAYAQCASIEDGAIWSNNGIDTASSSQGADWVRTQYSGGYQCTEFARRYFLFHWGIDYQHGNAGEWCDGTLPSNLALATSPTHGDLIVFAPGSCGADSTTGHIAVVDTVDTAGAKVTIVEQNQASRRSTQQSCAKCYLHAVENDGTPSGGASPGGAGGVGPSPGGAPSGGAGGLGPSPGGSPSGGAGGAGPFAGGSPSGGASSGGSTVGVAGSLSASGAATAGGSGSSGANASGMPSSSPSDEASSTDDAACSVGRIGAGNRRMGVELLLLGSALGLGLRLRRRRRG